MEDLYIILVHRLDLFIRKFYVNKIIQGIALLLVFSFVFLLIFSFGEFLFWFTSSIRTLIFYSYCFLLLFLLYFFIIDPLFRLFQLRQGISHHRASFIISDYFIEVKDQLINILELHETSDNKKYSQELVFASIDQKINNIKPFNFQIALPKRELKYSIWLFFGSFFVILFFLLVKPQLFTQGSYRIIHHNVYFEPNVGYSVYILNTSLTVERGNDFELQVKIEGNEIPYELYLALGSNKYLMTKSSKNLYSYLFKSINNDISFRFFSNNRFIGEYLLKVEPSPSIKDFKLEVKYPNYTNFRDEVYENIGDISVPSGSKLIWYFNCISTDSLILKIDSIEYLGKRTDGLFVFSIQPVSSFLYSLSLFNHNFKKENFLNFRILVTSDLFPSIRMVQIQDSLNPLVFYFNGLINDDFGFHNLVFAYQVLDKDSLLKISIPFERNSKSQEFYYAFNFYDFQKSNKGINYYFEVSDNDEINHFKVTKSEVFTFKVPSSEELLTMKNEANKRLEDNLMKSMMLAEEIKRDINQLNNNNFNNQLSDWERSKMINSVVEKQSRLEDLLKELNRKNSQSNSMFNNFENKSDELLERQKQIEDLLNSLMNDELRNLMDEFKKLSEKFDKGNLNELTKDLQYSYDDLKKQLDRNLELLKRYQIEEGLENIKNQIKNLGLKQEDLSSISSKSDSLNEVKEKQLEDKEALSKLKQEYNKLLEQNKSLEDKFKLEDFKDEFENINSDFKLTEEELNKNNKNKASKSQKSSSEKLAQLSQKMEQMMMENQMNQNAESIEDMRMILDNLLKFSFTQEYIVNNLENYKPGEPKYLEMVVMQKRLKDDFQIVSDSLYALSKRNAQLTSIVNKEIGIIFLKMDKALSDLESGDQYNGSAAGQYVMTSSNNLALILSESLSNMQMSGNSSGSPGNCSKPKKGKPGLSSLKQQQQSIKDQLQQMIKEMKNGKQPGEGKSSSKMISKMLAKEEIFQQQLNQLMNNSNVGSTTNEILKEINQMIEKNKKDLISRNISNELLQRQQMITTRLLEAENSEQERETENRRESHENKVEKLSNPKSLFEYNKENINFNEILNFEDLRFQPFYKDKVEQYIQNLNSVTK